MEDKEADSGGVTKAGTIQRDVARAGVQEISVCFSVMPTWLEKLTEYKQQESITVRYFDSETIAVKQIQMYAEGFKSKLEKDTSYKGLWTMSFVLKEF